MENFKGHNLKNKIATRDFLILPSSQMARNKHEDLK